MSDPEWPDFALHPIGTLGALCGVKKRICLRFIDASARLTLT